MYSEQLLLRAAYSPHVYMRQLFNTKHRGHSLHHLLLASPSTRSPLAKGGCTVPNDFLHRKHKARRDEHHDDSTWLRVASIQKLAYQYNLFMCPAVEAGGRQNNHLIRRSCPRYRLAIIPSRS